MGYGNIIHVFRHTNPWSQAPQQTQTSWSKSWLKRYALECLLQQYLQLTKTWKQPKCLLTDEWIKKMWYIYPMQYYTVIIKNEKNVIFSNMNRLGDYHSK